MFDELENKNSQMNNNLVQSKDNLIDDFEVVDGSINNNSNEAQNARDLLKIEKLNNSPKNNTKTEDIFSKTDTFVGANVIRPGSIAPKEPIKNYEELIKEVDSVQSNRIKPYYFFVGIIIILLIVGTGGLWAYKKFFNSTRDSGNVVLNTDTNETINLVNTNVNNDEITNNTEEIIIEDTYPVLEDKDGDGLLDQDEIEKYNTNPNNPDTDGDGLFDKEEVLIYKTDPNNPDTDEDGYTDKEEIDNNYSPTGPGRLLNLNPIIEIIEIEEIKSLNSEIDTSFWVSQNILGIEIKYPKEFIFSESQNKISISSEDKSFNMEIEIRDNKLEFDFVDWLLTQQDYPAFNQEQIKINNYDAIVVTSSDTNWMAKNSIFINHKDKVYSFNYFGNDTQDTNLKIFESIILSFNVK